MWHLLGSKSFLIIGQKSRKIARYYRRVLRKKATIKGKRGAFLGVGSGALVAPLASKITKDYPPKKSKMSRVILGEFWEEFT